MIHDLTVGVSTHGNRKEWLADTLDSLYFFNKEKIRLIVVDNASEDDTPAYLEKLNLRIDIQVIRNRVNGDDTKAMNQILPFVETDLFLKLDSDVVFTAPGVVKRAIDAIHETRVSAVGPFWDLSLKRRKEIFSWHGHEEMKSRFIHADQNVQQFSRHFEVTMRLPRGNFLLMRTEHIRQVGGFDESYPHNAMEYPFIVRLIEAGYDYAEFPAQEVIHKPSDDLRLQIRSRIPHIV